MVPFHHFLTEFNKLNTDVRKIFYDFFSNENPFLLIAESHWKPNVDIYRTKKGIIVKVELAGMKQKNLKILFENNKLKIIGSRHDYSIPEQVTCQQIEITYGNFERIISIDPEDKKIDEDNINATFKYGFLLIYLPFSKQNKNTKKNEINIEGE